MLPASKQTEILERHTVGQSIKRIAREMELSRNTVRQTIRTGKARRYKRTQKPKTNLEHYADWAKQRFYEVEGNATLLYQELKERGYPGGYSMVKELVRPLREDLHRKATIRYETPPGQQAQVDWGSKTIMLNGKPQRVHIFIMTLGYSRALYAELTTNEKLETLTACHENAFAWFGGVPDEILYDNPKTIVLDRTGDNARMNPKFEDFSRYYGYTARLCRPYRARTKGKVESGIKYIKRSFLPGKAFTDLTEANGILKCWVRETADERIHGTTFEKPSERMKDEKLAPLDARPAYMCKQPIMRKVSNDSMVNLLTNRYSVPWRYIGQLLEIRLQSGMVYVHKNNELIARHPAATRRHENIVEPSHYHGILSDRHTMQRIPVSAPEVQVRPLTDYEQLVLSWTDAAQPWPEPSSPGRDSNPFIRVSNPIDPIGNLPIRLNETGGERVG